jgi:hypothetical protein
VAFFSDDDGLSKKLSVNEVMNRVFAQIAPHAQLSVFGNCFVCFVDADRGGVCCADMLSGPKALDLLVCGIHRAQHSLGDTRTFPYVMRFVASDMRNHGSVGQKQLRAILLESFREHNLTPMRWLLEHRHQGAVTGGDAGATARARAHLTRVIVGDDGVFVTGDARDHLSDDDWQNLFDAAADLLADTVHDAEWY